MRRTQQADKLNDALVNMKLVLMLIKLTQQYKEHSYKL